MRGIIFLMALSFAVCVQAAEDYPDLPPRETVLQALSNAPGVQAARSGVSLSEASRTRLEAGPYEPNVRLNTQQRNVSNGPSYNEWSVSVERGLRLPGKAQLDQQLGAQGVTQAQFAYGDAWHEAGREVLHLWFTWMREHAQRRDWQHQVDTLTQQADVVRKRVQSGDAAQLELSLAEAAVSQAEQNLQQADQREQAALIGLTRRYPGIQPPERPVLTDPQPLTESLEAWRARILAGNHELQWVRSETQRAQLQAARTGRDRVPDPTLGVHYGSEQGGDEHIAGLFISIPITGAARRRRGKRGACASRNRQQQRGARGAPARRRHRHHLQQRAGQLPRLGKRARRGAGAAKKRRLDVARLQPGRGRSQRGAERAPPRHRGAPERLARATRRQRSTLPLATGRAPIVGPARGSRGTTRHALGRLMFEFSDASFCDVGWIYLLEANCSRRSGMGACYASRKVVPATWRTAAFQTRDRHAPLGGSCCLARPDSVTAL